MKCWIVGAAVLLATGMVASQQAISPELQALVDTERAFARTATVKGLRDSFLDYFYYLRYDERSQPEWPRIADALSVPESYFFREVDQIRAAIDVVIPELVDRYRGAPLPIWSVPKRWSRLGGLSRAPPMPRIGL